MIWIYNYTDVRKILRQKGTIVVTELVSDGDWVRLDKVSYLASIKGTKIPLDYNGEPATCIRYDEVNKVLYHFHGGH